MAGSKSTGPIATFFCLQFFCPSSAGRADTSDIQTELAGKGRPDLPRDENLAFNRARLGDICRQSAQAGLASQREAQPFHSAFEFHSFKRLSIPRIRRMTLDAVSSMVLEMKRGLLTLTLAGICFAGGWMAARHTLPVGRVTAGHPGVLRQTAEAPTIQAIVLAKADDASVARDDFVANLRHGGKPVDGERFEAWARTASLAELEAVISELGPSPEPTSEIRRLVAILASRDPDAGLRRFDEWSELVRFQLIGTLVWGWATQDPKAALDWLAAQPTNAATDGAREAALRRLAMKDPHGALATFRGNGWQWDSPKAMQTIFSVWAHSDPQTALTQWRTLDRELNPPIPPASEASLTPFTVELIAGIVERAKATSKVEPVEEALALFESGELNQVPAGFWRRLIESSDPSTTLPILEERLELSKMKEVVGLAARATRFAPERGQEMMHAIKHPELRELIQSFEPPKSSGWLGAPHSHTVMDKQKDGDGVDFWEKSITIEP